MCVHARHTLPLLKIFMACTAMLAYWGRKAAERPVRWKCVLCARSTPGDRKRQVRHVGSFEHAAHTPKSIWVEKSKLGDKEKSVAIKRLHRATKSIESKYTPTAFLKDLIEMEWKDAEKNGGMTFMGKTIKGLTKTITSFQNSILYGDKN